jgi:bifunctional DNA-binding transcriptional regulator/antitoxin component of YhaV-PrlF toxin-antitoxin module
METFQTVTTVTKKGKIIIPAPTIKAGARVRVTVTVDDEPVPQAMSHGQRLAALAQLRGSLIGTDAMSVDEWNQHKHEVWKVRGDDDVHAR